MKIGTKVKMINCYESEIYKNKIWTTRSETWILCGSKVVLLDGLSGAFDCDKLEVIQIEE